MEVASSPATPDSECHSSSSSSSSRPSASSSSCPQHILDVIQSRSRLPIQTIDECLSAQQQVWIITLESSSSTSTPLPPCYSSATDTTGGEISKEDANIDHDDLLLWRDCLRMGTNRLVVRLWKGGCQWWNLNRNSSPWCLAEQELFGYRQSRRALRDTRVVIPRIIFSQTTKRTTRRTNDHSIDNNDDLPWAIVEYVGPYSLYYLNTATIQRYDPTWVEGMVKMRHEFGFDEPHPRWGRVPESQALFYAVQILNQVILPLHLGSTTSEKEKEALAPDHDERQQYYTYESMIDLYQQAYQDLMKALVAAHYHQQDIMIENQVDSQQRWDQALALIQEAVYQVLPSNCHLQKIPVLQCPFPSMVLVHLDLQPQNLLLARHPNDTTTDNNNNETNTGDDNPVVVSSVLDWEDAAMADPRFEILLLARKVCANRDQAEQVWKHYAEQVCLSNRLEERNNNNEDDDSSSSPFVLLPPVVRLGPLKPWLQLETIHSLLTMLSQSMDLLNGGRNPWETSDDLWGKIEREMARWQAMLSSTSNGDGGVSLGATTTKESSSTIVPAVDTNNDDDVYLADLGIDPAKCFRS